MRYKSLPDLVSSNTLAEARGPVAAIIAEDEIEVASTLRHHIEKGFRTVLLFAPAELDAGSDQDVIRIDCATREIGITPTIMASLVDALPTGTWLYYCYNAEYLFYPFSEHRSVGEMLTFHSEERRKAMLAYVVDVYAGDLGTADEAVDLQDTWLDQSGYFARARPGVVGPKERQLDFHGGLRWRFEELIPKERRRIDRIPIAKTAPGLRLRDDHTWSDEELNTYACPWHNNLTAAIVSFRTAKALRTNPGSRSRISSYRWQNSQPFEWHSQQLMDLGLMEPGQWF